MYLRSRFNWCFFCQLKYLKYLFFMLHISKMFLPISETYFYWSVFFCVLGNVCILEYLKQMKVKIKQWHGVASWLWVANDENCGICRAPFNGCCPDCRSLLFLLNLFWNKWFQFPLHQNHINTMHARCEVLKQWLYVCICVHVHAPAPVSDVPLGPVCR